MDYTCIAYGCITSSSLAEVIAEFDMFRHACRMSTSSGLNPTYTVILKITSLVNGAGSASY